MSESIKENTKSNYKIDTIYSEINLLKEFEYSSHTRCCERTCVVSITLILIELYEQLLS